jgi:hypothetical protein
LAGVAALAVWHKSAMRVMSATGLKTLALKMLQVLQVLQLRIDTISTILPITDTSESQIKREWAQRAANSSKVQPTFLPILPA